MHRRMSRRKLALFLGDFLFIGFTLVILFLIQMADQSRALNAPIRNGWRFLPFFSLWIAYMTSFYIFDLYNPRLKIRDLLFVVLFGAAMITVAAWMTLFFYLFPQQLERVALLLHLLLTACFAIFWRLIFSWMFKRTVPRRNVLFIGTDQQSEEFMQSIDGRDNRVFIAHGIEEIRSQPLASQPIQQIIFSLDSLQDIDLATHLVDCKLKGIQVLDMPSFVEAVSEKIPLHLVEERWLLQCRGFDQWGRFLYKRLRRIIDLLAGFLILLAGLPIAVAIAAAIKLTSAGPVFYTQQRVGKNHQQFRLIKFRTMVKNAEGLMPRYAALHDPRITAVGKFLRHLRLDELPQAFNIIRGDMSFIGPRPERPEWVSQFAERIPLYSLRFHIKPGLTGWAQVQYRYGDSDQDTREKLQYDLYYIKNMSLLMDLRIMLKTVRIILLGKGR